MVCNMAYAIFFWINFQLFVYVPGEAGVSLSDLVNCMPHIVNYIAHIFTRECLECGRIWCVTTFRRFGSHAPSGFIIAFVRRY